MTVQFQALSGLHLGYQRVTWKKMVCLFFHILFEILVYIVRTFCNLFSQICLFHFLPQTTPTTLTNATPPSPAIHLPKCNITLRRIFLFVSFCPQTAQKPTQPSTSTSRNPNLTKKIEEFSPTYPTYGNIPKLTPLFNSF